MRDTEREAETQAEREAGSMKEAQRGTLSQIPESSPGPKADAQPLSHPASHILLIIMRAPDLSMETRFNEQTISEPCEFCTKM